MREVIEGVANLVDLYKISKEGSDPNTRGAIEDIESMTIGDALQEMSEFKEQMSSQETSTDGGVMYADRIEDQPHFDVDDVDQGIQIVVDAASSPVNANDIEIDWEGSKLMLSEGEWDQTIRTSGHNVNDVEVSVSAQVFTADVDLEGIDRSEESDDSEEDENE